MMEKTMRIKYHSDEIEKLEYIAGKSDWIDLRASFGDIHCPANPSGDCWGISPFAPVCLLPIRLLES